MSTTIIPPTVPVKLPEMPVQLCVANLPRAKETSSAECSGKSTLNAILWLTVIILLLLQNSRSLEEKLFLIVKCGIFWCIGFGGMWVSKFIISRLVCGYSFSRIMNMVASDSLSKKALLPSVEASNLTTFLHTPVSWLVILVIDNKFQKIRKNTSINQHEAYRTVFPYLLISLVPFVWYAFATVHSAAHYWFTNKACAVSLLGILFAITSIQASRNKQPS